MEKVLLSPWMSFDLGTPKYPCFRTLGYWGVAMCRHGDDIPLAGSPVTPVSLLAPDSGQGHLLHKELQIPGAIQWRKWGPKPMPTAPLFAGVNTKSFVVGWLHVCSGLESGESTQAPLVPFCFLFWILFSLLLLSVLPYTEVISGSLCFPELCIGSTSKVKRSSTQQNSLRCWKWSMSSLSNTATITICDCQTFEMWPV